MTTSEKISVLGFIGGATLVGMLLVALFRGASTVKHTTIPVYSDVIPGHVIRQIPVQYSESMENGELVYTVSYEADDMQVSVSGFTSLHEAFTTVRDIVIK